MVVIFRRDPVRGWVFVTSLLGNGAASGDQFGFSVALSGNLLVVGAPFDDTNSGTDAGSYSVYFRNETASGVGTWQLRWKTDLLPSNQLAAGAHMGWSVAVQGQLIGGGAPMQRGEQGKLFLGLDYLPALFFP